MARKTLPPLPPTIDAKTAALPPCVRARAGREARLKPDTKAQLNGKAAPTQPAKAERPKGVGYYIRKATIAAYPEVASVAAIESALADVGIRGTKRSTIDTFRTDCLSVLRIAQELGKLAERAPRKAGQKKEANERTEEAA
jgi:hypothetical protein